MDQNYAKLALELIGTTRIQGDDASLHATLQTRQWLRDIVSGRLVVTTAVPAEAPPATPPAPEVKPTKPSKVSKLPTPAGK